MPTITNPLGPGQGVITVHLGLQANIHLVALSPRWPPPWGCPTGFAGSNPALHPPWYLHVFLSPLCQQRIPLCTQRLGVSLNLPLRYQVIPKYL